MNFKSAVLYAIASGTWPDNVVSIITVTCSFAKDHLNTPILLNFLPCSSVSFAFGFWAILIASSPVRRCSKPVPLSAFYGSNPIRTVRSAFVKLTILITISAAR